MPARPPPTPILTSLLDDPAMYRPSPTRPVRGKRAVRAEKRAKASNKGSGTDVLPETYGWNDYWQKLATQAAGKNLPDLIQMDYRYIFEYARRRQLAALDDFMGKQLNQIGAYDGGKTNSRPTSEVLGFGTSEQVGTYEVQ